MRGEDERRPVPPKGKVTVTVTATSASTEITWSREERLASVRYTPGTILTSTDGDFLVEALTEWIGPDDEPFGVLADAAGLYGTDAEYRAKASGFSRQHRKTGFIALVNLGPVIHVVVELFRVATGIQLKTFADDAAARSWSRTKGISA